MSKHKSLKSHKSKSKSHKVQSLASLIEEYISLIDTKGEECTSKRIVNKKLKNMHINKTFNNLDDIANILSSINNTLNNEFPLSKMGEHCGKESVEMLKEIQKVMEKKSAFGQRSKKLLKKSKKGRKSLKRTKKTKLVKSHNLFSLLFPK